MSTETKPNLGILVGGGPAPGINGVISAATIEAVENGLEVIGLYDGFKWLMRGDVSQVRTLTIPDVSWIHFEGGSVLRTARDNPTKSEEALQKVLDSLEQLGIGYLVTIGGDDTAFSASQITKRAEGRIKVAHVPKTIDNDLPLPDNMPTFGFQTARHIGTQLVQNLMEDARTTTRWYFVVAMGREAGHLALGIGKATSATVTVIGEEFPEDTISINRVADILEGSILKRRAMDRDYGVAIIAEGIGHKLDEEEIKNLPGAVLEKDEHGHIRLAEVPIGNILKRLVRDRFVARGDKVTIVDLPLGYELRCAPPIPFDRDYVRDLGHAAVQYLLQAADDETLAPGALIAMRGGHADPIPFDNILDSKTGRTSVRLVDINSGSYRVARDYMIRLERADFEDEKMLAKLAATAKTSPDEFRQKYGPVVGL
jgi:6-phosphofructokinase 1